MTRAQSLPDLLTCSGGGSLPVQYFMSSGGQEYLIYYKYGEISVTVGWDVETELLCQTIGDESDSDWNDEQTTVYLTLISEAIRGDRLESLVLPSIAEAPEHEFYTKGILPLHRVGLVCGRIQSRWPRSSRMNRHDRRKRRQAGLHDHVDNCYVWVPANEVDDWIAEHPDQHKALKREESIWHRLWNRV